MNQHTEAVNSEKQCKEVGMTTQTKQPIAEVLQQLNSGNTMNDLSIAMGGLIAKVRQTGKVGELTLKIKVRLASKGTDHVLQLEDLLTVREPLEDRAETIFYADKHNRLMRNDPNQPDLPMGELAVVPTAAPVASADLLEVQNG